MPFPWAAIGTAAATAGVNYAMQTGGTNRNYNKQRRLNVQAQEISKDLTDYNMTKQYDLWQRTGPTGQKAELLKAGLNPALIYGMGGGQGQTANVNTGSANGGSVQQGSSDYGLTNGMMAGVQMELLEAQKENIDADTNLKNTEAKKKAGVDTDLGRAQIKDITAGIEVKGAEVKLKEAQTAQQNIQNSIDAATYKESIEIVKKNLEALEQNIRSLKVQGNIDEKTEADKIKQIKAEAIGAVIRNTLMRKEIDEKTQNIEESKKRVDLMSKQISAITNEIMLSGERLSNDNSKLRMELEKHLDQQDYGVIDDILNNLNFVLPIGGGAHKAIQGFRR